MPVLAPDSQAATAAFDAYKAQTTLIRQRVTDMVAAAWRRLPDVHDESQAAFVRLVVPLVLGGQRHMASMTDAYFAALASQALGRPNRPVGIASPYPRKDVTPDVVYARPVNQVRYDLSQGKTYDQAFEAGLTRAISLAQTDIQLAKTQASYDLMSSDSEITGWERVPAGGKVCALCLIASTQRYHTEDLMPIHPSCACDVEPLYGTRERVIHPDRLAEVEDALAERFPDGEQVSLQRDIESGRSRAANNVLIVHNHGELGPVLGIRGQDFTGPDDI